MKAIYTRDLAMVSQGDFEEVGGKGANLGEMIRAGLPVPGGFVVLTSAYGQFVEAGNLAGRVEGWLRGIDPEDIPALDAATGRIRQAFEETPIPAEVIREIRACYETMGAGAVAIRSSSTAEDLPGLSFAGQYSSYLNVRGHDEVLRRVRECWASLWNSRAVAYRLRENIPNETLGHGVVVQSMVDAEKAGILFTANPVNGRRDQLLLNASWGLGEAIVGGEVNPDQWVIATEDGRVLEEHIARKEVMTIRRPSGVELTGVPEEAQEASTLDSAEIQALHQLAGDVERYFQTPQDIEWAWQNGRFWLVQTRPITSLYPLPAPRDGKEGFRVFLNLSKYSQAMEEPFTPMGEQVVRSMAARMVSQYGKKGTSGDPFWWYQNLGGRIFVDITDFMRTEKSWNKFRGEDSNDKDPQTTRALLQLAERNRSQLIDPARSVRLGRLLRPKLLGLLVQAGGRYAYGMLWPEAARKKAVALGEQAVAEVAAAVAGMDSTEERIRFLEERMGTVFVNCFGLLSYVSASSTYIEKVRSILEKTIGDASDLGEVEKSVPHSVTTQMGMEILQLARAYDAEGTRPEAGDPAIREFLATYGHRSAVELDVGVPTWAEEPRYVLDLINSYIDSQSYGDGLDRFRQGATDAEAAIRRIREKLDAAGHRRKARSVERMLWGFREMFGIREQSKFVITQVMQILREMLRAVGDDLVAAGELSDPDDVFFLTLEEIRRGGDLRQAVRENREQFAIDGKRSAPRILTSTGECVYAPAGEADGDSLGGIPVSPGVCEGRVRILESPEEGHRLEAGDILVTTGTNPAWTPLFLKLGALVMETGGSISHGSVVAREYGLPAVAGVSGATRLLRDGQRVRVNGETGRVEAL